MLLHEHLLRALDNYEKVFLPIILNFVGVGSGQAFSAVSKLLDKVRRLKTNRDYLHNNPSTEWPQRPQIVPKKSARTHLVNGHGLDATARRNVQNPLEISRAPWPFGNGVRPK